jgi:methionyl-tRNA formyltransferase
VTLVYIGSSAFALAVLDAAGLEPALVVTRQPAPRGRGRRIEPTPLAAGARGRGLEVREPERLEDLAGELAALRPEVLCLCAYGAMVREPLLSDYEILGVHPSLLPRWRGAAPIERSIMAGDERTGVSLLRLVAALDAGPLCATGELAIRPGDDYGSLSARLAALAGSMLAEALRGPRTYVPQDDRADVTYADKITAAERVLDPGRPAPVLERTVRALRPHIGARLPDGLGVARARVAAGPELEPGELRVREGRLYFGASPGILELECVKPPGGRAMDAAAYLRGHAFS